MISLRLRDRDAIIASGNIIFRVYGYSHPPQAYICDPEYALASTYRSKDSRAYRASGEQVYCKFFADEGLKFVQREHPQHMVWYQPLQKKLVGVKKAHIVETRQPDKKLRYLAKKQPADTLLQALQELFNLIQERSKLSKSSFGVFGSLLHDFYHPTFSDLDLIIYGVEELRYLRETLKAIYREDNSALRNEFDSVESVKGKRWRFQNYSIREYLWHQTRKQVYALLYHRRSRRNIKTEFEPVKKWQEIQNKYNESTEIVQQGWIKLLARVTDDNDSFFMPSVYQIEPIKIIAGTHADHIKRIVSYVEEFRMQAQIDERVIAEGILEQVSTSKQNFHQVTLTYCPRYYEQVLKVEKI